MQEFILSPKAKRATRKKVKSQLEELQKSAKFKIDNIKSVFEIQPNVEKINLILAVLTKRKVDNGCSVKFLKKFYRLVDKNGHMVNYSKGTAGMVIKAFNNELFFCVNEIIYALEEIPEHEIASKNFDILEQPKEPRKRYIPPMNHPWKLDSFNKYFKKKNNVA